MPVGKDSSENVTVKKWGTIKEFTFTPKNHIDLAIALDQIDMERAGKIAGARFFYLKNDVAMLDMALMHSHCAAALGCLTQYVWAKGE